MNLQTLTKLRKLREKYGAGQAGKVLQKLLAIAFSRIGFEHIVERSVEGVDIDASGGSGKFAIEVKTTETSFINLSKENINALRKRIKDNYVPTIVALRLTVLEEWVFSVIPLNELIPGKIPIDALRAYRDKNIEILLSAAFENVIAEHYCGTLEGGQGYLNNQLELIGVEVEAI